jgi:hypothetical protein
LRFNKVDPMLTCIGLLGGLVAITGAGGSVGTLAAVLTGAVAGLLIPWATVVLDLRFRLDDPTAVVAIHGIAASGLEGIDARHRIRILPGPPAPLALRVADANGQVAMPRPAFAWAEVEGAADYRMQIARDAGFADPVVDSHPLRKTRLRPQRDLAPGVYHWRVGARDAAGNTGPYSSAERFEVIPAPPRELQVRKDERILRWQAADDGSRYRVQVARRADFARPTIDRVVDAPQLDLRELGGGRWHVRMQTVHEDGYAEPFEAPQTIRLPCGWCKGAALAAGLLLLTL